jgi:hypothetical protein
VKDCDAVVVWDDSPVKRITGSAEDADPQQPATRRAAMAKKGLEADIWLEDSALFLSDSSPDKALRRWYETHLPQMQRTVDFLNGLGEVVRESSALSEVVIVAEVHKVGSDWILVDYDASSVPIAERVGDQQASEICLRCSELLRDRMPGEPAESPLRILDDMLRSSSASVHWSTDKRKLLVVGAG